MWKEDFLERADGCSQQRSDEKSGRKHSAGSSAGERHGGRRNLEDSQQQQHLQRELSVHRLVDGTVACAHHLRKANVSDVADEQTRILRLEPFLTLWRL